MIRWQWNAPGTPGCIFTLLGGIFVIVSLILLAIGGSQLLRQQGYQSGQCTITAKQLQQEVSSSTTTDSSGHTTSTTSNVYAPYFEYIVHTADGRSYKSSGYDGSDTYTSDHVGQQGVIDQYEVEKSYQCWYNPAKPTEAVLVRRPNWLVLLLGGGFLLLGLIFTGIGLFVLVGLLVRGGLFWHRSSGRL